MGGPEGREPPGVPRARRALARARDLLWVGVVLVGAWFLWPSSLGGCTTLTIVSGHSMEPTYYTGDLVVARCGDVGVGDVVVYTPPDVGGARVIHRIVGQDGDGWVLQGDNNGFLDPWTPTDDDVLGSAVLHVPNLGTVAGILLSPMIWVSLLVLAAAVLVWPPRAHAEPAEGTAPEPSPELQPEPSPELQPVPPPELQPGPLPGSSLHPAPGRS